MRLLITVLISTKAIFLNQNKQITEIDFEKQYQIIDQGGKEKEEDPGYEKPMKTKRTTVPKQWSEEEEEKGEYENFVTVYLQETIY